MDLTTIFVIVIAVGAFLIYRQSGLVNVDLARQYLKSGAVVIDVRSPREFESSHLQGALNVPMGQLRHDIGTHVPDRKQVLLLHCLSGTRSGMARRTLKGLGYANCYNLGSYGRAQQIVEGN